MNHLAHGEFHSRTFFHGLNQCSSLAALAQKAWGFLRALLKTLAFLKLADFLNSFGGGKFLFSSNKTSMALSAMMQPPCQIVCGKTKKTFRILWEAHSLGKTRRSAESSKSHLQRLPLQTQTRDLKSLNALQSIDAVRAAAIGNT